MYKTIVLGCDGSMGSIAAIELAARLSDPDGRLILTCVYPAVIAIPEFGPHDENSRMHDEAEEILRLSAKRVPEGTNFETLAEPRMSVAAGLNDVAEREHADLIVLGPSHHHSLGRITGQMTVQRLLHGAPCAVAVAGGGDISERIVVGYDGSAESRAAVRAAYGIAEATGAAVELHQVVLTSSFAGPYLAALDPEVRDHVTERVEAELAERKAEAPSGVTVTTHVDWGRPEGVLLGAADAGAGLIVAGSRGYGTAHRAIAGSVSGVLLTQSHASVLVTPRGAESARQAA